MRLQLGIRNSGRKPIYFDFSDPEVPTSITYQVLESQRDSGSFAPGKYKSVVLGRTHTDFVGKTVCPVPEHVVALPPGSEIFRYTDLDLVGAPVGLMKITVGVRLQRVSDGLDCGPTSFYVGEAIRKLHIAPAK